MSYSPMMFCEKCRQIKREDWMKTKTVCIACHEGGQSEDESGRAKAGARKAPKHGERKNAQPRRQVRHQLQLGF